MKKPTQENEVLNPLDQYSELDHFLESENQCCLCGTELLFAHEFNYLEGSLVERALCPQCQIKTREREHILH